MKPYSYPQQAPFGYDHIGWCTKDALAHLVELADESRGVVALVRADSNGAELVAAMVALEFCDAMPPLVQKFRALAKDATDRSTRLEQRIVALTGALINLQLATERLGRGEAAAGAVERALADARAVLEAKP